MKKVCHISTVHAVKDDRIFFKQCRTLADDGYDVSLVVQHNRNEVLEGINIIALRSYSSKYGRMFRAPWKAMRLALSTKAKVFHFHDPELLGIGVMLRLFGKKVVYDVHENVPEQIITKSWIGPLFIRKLIAFWVRVIEKVSSWFFSRVVVVTKGIGEKFSKKKTFLIRNLPILSMIKDVSPWEKDGSKHILVYSGGITRIRGVVELISAMSYTKDDVELWLLGEWESEELKKECEALPGWEKVKYIGYVPMKEVYGYLKAADIGLINYLPVPNHFDSLPNKPFEYMACGLPMVMTNFPKWQEYFNKCALFVECTDPNDIAEKINLLIDDSSLKEAMSKTGIALVKEELSWEAESVRFLEMYESII